MSKKTLIHLFNGAVFNVPDYQRGYAWEDKQWRDFVEDIDALVTDPNIKAHFTGTIVTFAGKDANLIYCRKPMQRVEVVDGQQRLTTICLYLSVIIRALIQAGESEYGRDIPEFLYDGAICKLTLNNESNDLYYNLLKTGKPATPPSTIHQQRLSAAADFFSAHIRDRMAEPAAGLEFVRELFQALTGKLYFTHYEIDEECEIGMTFELMNSRGKGLSVLELLKNYFMHWIFRNGRTQAGERAELTGTVNRSWRSVYENLARTDGSESQCLRISWVLYCHHLPKNWHGYDGFKDISYFPLRDFSKKTLDQTRTFLITFAEGLAELSQHYASVVSPREEHSLSAQEYEWLTKIRNTGNVANFLPLVVAARVKTQKGLEGHSTYIRLLKSIEKYAYRVFLVEGKRSNAGKSSFYRWAKEIHDGQSTLGDVIPNIESLLEYYAAEDSFKEKIQKISNWYGRRNLLRYTLYEYEVNLLEAEGHGKQPALSWSDIAKDSTIEHILPQSPAEGSHWLQTWSTPDREKYLHDISNLVLTLDNASYMNFDFDRKKGQPGKGPSYNHSDIRQEREISAFPDWDVEAAKSRRQKLVNWIIKERWKGSTKVAKSIFDDEADEDTESI